jgi:AcrR family transcriptional regulator
LPKTKVAGRISAGSCAPRRYFLAAYELLAERGPTGLTVAALCERTHLTNGSFYHHFGSMNGFVEAFAANWVADFSALMTRIDSEPDPVRRMELQGEVFLRRIVPAECAILGSWSTTNPVLAAAVRQAGDHARSVTGRALTELNGDAEQAQVAAHMALALALGIYREEQPIDLARVAAILKAWYRGMTGLQAHIDIDGDAPIVRLRRIPSARIPR